MKSLWSWLRINWALVAGIVILIGVGDETVKVRSEDRALIAKIHRDQAAVVAIGDRLGDLAGTNVDGLHARYSLTGQPIGSLVIELSATCSFCQRNREVWQRLSSTAARLGVQVVWVSRDTAVDGALGQTSRSAR